jgi:hypothetical protein
MSGKTHKPSSNQSVSTTSVPPLAIAVEAMKSLSGDLRRQSQDLLIAKKQQLGKAKR